MSAESKVKSAFPGLSSCETHTLCVPRHYYAARGISGLSVIQDCEKLFAAHFDLNVNKALTGLTHCRQRDVQRRSNGGHEADRATVDCQICQRIEGQVIPVWLRDAHRAKRVVKGASV